MKTLDVVRDSLKTVWQRKSLWLFGIFIAGSSGSGGDQSPAGGAGGPDIEGFPMWLIPVIATAVIVGIAGLIMHLISEGALIQGVARTRDGSAFGVRDGFREGWAHAGVLLKIKALLLAVALPAVGLIALPAILFQTGVLPLVPTIVLSVPLVLVGVPGLVSLYLVYEFAQRIAVLENRRALDAVRRSRLFLHRRLLSGLKLILTNAVAQIGLGLVVVVCAVPAAPFAGIGYLLGEWVGAAIGGGVVFVPLLIAAIGAHGTFRSSVWTLGFLAEREAEAN